MKTIEYVRKYKLNEDDHFNHTKFLKDFVNDFNSMLSEANINNDYVRFRRLVEDMKKKWDNINEKTVGNLFGGIFMQQPSQSVGMSFFQTKPNSPYQDKTKYFL